jgi:hypothetical protein
MTEGRKSLLFLKKKKQKDFSHFAPGAASGTRAGRKSFLVLFFKKERAFLPSYPPGVIRLNNTL